MSVQDCAHEATCILPPALSGAIEEVVQEWHDTFLEYGIPESQEDAYLAAITQKIGERIRENYLEYKQQRAIDAKVGI